MTEDELMQLIRVRQVERHVMVEVQKVEGATERWVMVKLLKKPVMAVDVTRAVRMLLSDYQHFRVCDDCRERFPRSLVSATSDGRDLCGDCVGGPD